MGELGTLILHAAERTRSAIVDASALRRRDQTTLLQRASLVLVGRATCDGQPSEGLIELIRSRHPHVSIWVCARPDQGVGVRLVRFANAGAGWVAEIGTPKEFAALVRYSQNRVRAPAPSALIWSVHTRVERRETRILAIDCLLESFRRRLVSDFERRFGHDHKTLTGMLQRAKLVGIGELQRAGRLAHDEELRRFGLYTREQIARRLGFGSAKRLAHAWRTAAFSGLVRDGEVVVFCD